jgi:NCS2 family nucleobase:cation symporter-2/xanthine permease XanP
MGLYDIGMVIEAQWVSLPDLTWRGFDFTFGVEFWSLLPGFVFVSLTAYLKSLGDLSAIYQASYREPRALDHRVVQSGLNLYGGTTFLTGVLGTVPISAPWAVTVVYVSFTGVASKVVGIYLGLATLAVAPFSKLIALLVVVPSPVLSAIYVIIFGALFVEGAKIAFAGQMDHKRGTIIGVSLVVGISAESLAGQLEGSLGNIAGSVVASDSAVALAMTAITELTGIRRRKLEVDLALSSLTPIAEFLDGFAANRGWSEEARNRLHHVGEEVTLSLLEQGEENEFSEGEDRRLTATAQAEGDSVEVEFVVFSHDTTGQNIEDRLAYMDSDSELEDGEQFSMRLLSHYASSVHHRKYYGIDIVTVRVDR